MLYLKSETRDALWGVWKVEEDYNELLNQLTDNEELNKNVLNLVSESRIIERLAVRILLKKLIGHEQRISYQDSGKPYLENKQYHLSISHTKGYVAIYLHKDKEVGIDIETISNRVKRVQNRFISDAEYIDPKSETIHLLLHWSAKETAYKVLNCVGVDLRNDLRIMHFLPQKEGACILEEFASPQKQKLTIDYLVDSEFVLTMTSI